MRRRGTVSRKPAKPQFRKPTRPKRSNAPMAARRRSPSAADLQKQLDQRTRERDEALEQQATTSEILGIVARSPTNVQHSAPCCSGFCPHHLMPSCSFDKFIR